MLSSAVSYDLPNLSRRVEPNRIALDSESQAALAAAVPRKD